MPIKFLLRLMMLSWFFYAHTGIAASTVTPTLYTEQADQLIAQTKIEQPALAILAKQYNGFDNEWRELLRQQLIVNDDRNKTKLSQAIGLSLTLSFASTYYAYADDQSIDFFLQLQRQMLAQAQDDARLCSLLLNTASSRVDQQGTRPWLLDKKYKGYMPTIQTAMTQLIQSAQTPWPRVLPEQQSQLFMRRIISQMADTYGQDSIKHYEQMNNDNVNPAIRCQALYQLYETINQQPLELRAQLIRSFFG
ncbi:MAG: hypothetical protein KA902_04350 [Arenimonas sp.]|nr:hypothetical protein [Arenimonas sp.]